MCISATFPPQHLSRPDSHHKPEQSSAPNPFYSHFPGTALAWSFKSAGRALQLRVGRRAGKCGQGCLQVQHVFLSMMEKQIASMPPLPRDLSFQLGPGAVCEAVFRCKLSPPSAVAQTCGVWHKYCGWEKRKLVHKATGQDAWALLPCAANVPVTSLHLDRLSSGEPGELLGAHQEGMWGIPAVVGIFHAQEESVQSLLACVSKKSASVWTVFTTWLWKISSWKVMLDFWWALTDAAFYIFVPNSMGSWKSFLHHWATSFVFLCIWPGNKN